MPWKSSILLIGSRVMNAAYEREFTDLSRPSPRGAALYDEPESRSDVRYRGIYDVVAADKSELGKSTLVALKSVEIGKALSAKSFFALRHFRGRYGFTGKTRYSISLIIIILLVISIANSPKHTIILPTFLLSAALILKLTYLVVVTPLLSSRTKVEIADGRILITYGLFSTHRP